MKKLEIEIHDEDYYYLIAKYALAKIHDKQMLEALAKSIAERVITKNDDSWLDED